MRQHVDGKVGAIDPEDLNESSAHAPEAISVWIYFAQ